MALNTISTTEFELELLEVYHAAKIAAKYYSTDKLLNLNLILGRDILYELGLIFKFEYKSITLQEISISMKPPNCTEKAIFVIKESCPVKNAT